MNNFMLILLLIIFTSCLSERIIWRSYSSGISDNPYSNTNNRPSSNNRYSLSEQNLPSSSIYSSPSDQHLSISDDNYHDTKVNDNAYYKDGYAENTGSSKIFISSSSSTSSASASYNKPERPKPSLTCEENLGYQDKSSTSKPNDVVNETPIAKADDYDINTDKDYDYDYKDSSDCICVPYYQCAKGRIVDDGSGILDPRNKAPSEKELPIDKHYEPPYCGAFHVCCSDPDTQAQIPYVHKCGIRNPSGINGRVLSPTKKGEADFGEWPWQVAVLKVERDVNIFLCGASLIDSWHVITVAHCVAEYADKSQYVLKVRLGEWDTQHKNEFLPHDDYEVETVIIHEQYSNKNLWNDIAILKLDSKVEFRPNIDTICLPGKDENFDGQECVTTGWGKNAYRGGQYSNILKEVSLPIVPNYDCQKKLRKTRLGPRFRLYDRFICAGGETGIDSCKGDGGGPLVCYRSDGTYALVGIVSWGIECGQTDHPGVYIRVQEYLEWITEKTGNSIDQYSSTASGYS